MRHISVVILIVIGVSLFSAGIPFLPFGSSGTASLQSLDICHTAAPVVNSDLPGIFACPCCPIPAFATGTVEFTHTEFNPLILASQDERPPEA